MGCAKKSGKRWKVKSAVTGKWLKPTYKTKAKAMARRKTSKRRSQRKRSRR